MAARVQPDSLRLNRPARRSAEQLQTLTTPDPGGWHGAWKRFSPMTIAKLATALVGGAVALVCVYDAGQCLRDLSTAPQPPGEFQSATRAEPEPALVLWLPSELSDEVAMKSLALEEFPAPLGPNHRASKGPSSGSRRDSSLSSIE